MIFSCPQQSAYVKPDSGHQDESQAGQDQGVTRIVTGRACGAENLCSRLAGMACGISRELYNPVDRAPTGPVFEAPATSFGQAGRLSATYCPLSIRLFVHSISCRMKPGVFRVPTHTLHFGVRCASSPEQDCPAQRGLQKRSTFPISSS